MKMESCSYDSSLYYYSSWKWWSGSAAPRRAFRKLPAFSLTLSDYYYLHLWPARSLRAVPMNWVKPRQVAPRVRSPPCTRPFERSYDASGSPGDGAAVIGEAHGRIADLVVRSRWPHHFRGCLDKGIQAILRDTIPERRSTKRRIWRVSPLST